MSEFIPTIRNTPRAVIIRDGQILLLRKGGDDRGERYVLPGGAQETGESLEQAIIRECQEEIGAEVEVRSLLSVTDFYKLKETQPLLHRHYLEFLFRCEVDSEYVPCNGSHPDSHQLEVVWFPLDRLAEITLFPPYLHKALDRLDQPASYLGSFYE